MVRKQIPEVSERELVAQLEEYASLRDEAASLELELKNRKEAIEVLVAALDRHPELNTGMQVEGFKLKLVKPVRSELSRKLLLTLLSPEQVEFCTLNTEGAPYLRIEAPKRGR